MLNFGFGKRKRLQHLLEKRVVRGLGKTGAPRARSSLTAPVFPACPYAAQRQQALRWGKAPRTLAGWFKILKHIKRLLTLLNFLLSNLGCPVALQPTKPQHFQPTLLSSAWPGKGGEWLLFFRLQLRLSTP